MQSNVASNIKNMDQYKLGLPIYNIFEYGFDCRAKRNTPL